MTIQNLYFLWLWYISSVYPKKIGENNAWERNNRNCYMSTNWVWDDRFLSCQSFFSFLLQLFDFIQQFWSKTKRTIRSHHHSVLLAVRTHNVLSKFKNKYMYNFGIFTLIMNIFQIEHLWKGNDFLMKILFQNVYNYQIFLKFFHSNAALFSLFLAVYCEE